MDGMLELEKQSKDKPPKVYSYEKAVERYIHPPFYYWSYSCHLCSHSPTTCSTFRLMAGNESLTEKSAKILLERGLVQVEGGKNVLFHFKCVFLSKRRRRNWFFCCRGGFLPRHASSFGMLQFSFVIPHFVQLMTFWHFVFQKNIVRISLEQSLDFQSRIEASVLVVL